MFNKREYAKKYYLDNKERLLEEMKIWKKDNPEYMKNWRKKNKKERLEYQRKWEKENKKLRSIYSKRWQKDNRETISKNRKEYLKQYNLKNKKEISEYNKNYQKIWLKTEEGKASHQRDGTKRRAKFKEILNTLTAKEWIDILKKYHFKCAYCGKEFDLFDRPARDHIIPISKGGNNIKENVLPACRNCNSKKHNKINWEVKENAFNY